jgi:NAD(P)-dependent dehydrogenase (short-subunit alcohol dehydrogenase family)
MNKVLITGAGGGFGILIAKQLISNGFSVVGSMRDTKARNKDKKLELEKLGAKVVEMDVTNTDSVNKGVAEAIQLLNGIDIVVNNAGIGVLGLQENFTPEDFHKVFDVNLYGVQRVNRAIIPHMRSKSNGIIIHISSLLGRISVPNYGPYNASKWALEALAESYRAELSQFGIESCIIEPGGFATSFVENLLRPSDNSRMTEQGELAKFPEEFLKNFETALASNPNQNPELVATALIDLLKMPKGKKPFRTIVDNMGMGVHIEGYNAMLSQITEGIYSAFGLGHLLQVKGA